MQIFDYKKYTWIAGGVALLCVASAAISTVLVDMNSLKHPNGAVASITVSGEGEVTSAPDIATITATVREVANSVPEAQKAVEAKISQALADMSSMGIDKKDIKTLSYSVNPKYETNNIYCITTPCPPTKTVIVGYEVAETVQIKVRKIDLAGNVLASLGKANITETDGPNFTIDNIDKLKADAKVIAIKKAQDKAKATAEALGVSLGEITQFNEDSGGAYPVMYSMSAMKLDSSERVTLPQGESSVKSNVTITYSLK